MVSFNSDAIMQNVMKTKELVRRIRQNESVGSSEDELTLCRSIHDIDTLLDIIKVLKLKHEELTAASGEIIMAHKQIETLNTKLREMVKDREDRIRQLEENVGQKNI